ncbi:hypothetical protein, partial [Escherichia coli]|uniref:hypothetical protein n=1 Tax=Escherichia coli TaxID=562 RepID=UPI001BDBD935
FLHWPYTATVAPKISHATRGELRRPFVLAIFRTGRVSLCQGWVPGGDVARIFYATDAATTAAALRGITE